MSVASLEFNTLNLTQLNVGNSQYMDSAGYVERNTTILSTKNSSTISTGGIISSGLIQAGNGLDVYGTGGYVSLDCIINDELNLVNGSLNCDGITSQTNLTTLGSTNLAGVYFGSIAGPIVCVGSSSTLSTLQFPFPSSSITQVMCTIGALNVSVGGIVVSCAVQGPFSDINTTVKFSFYNPTNQTITIANASIILFNPSDLGGLLNIT